jgi:PKD repeat protein
MAVVKCLFLTLGLILLAALPLSAQFAGGAGTESDPWLIATPTQLNAIRNYLGEAHSDKHFNLIADIDIGVDSWGYWSPIGTETPFYGHLDGCSHSVSNMTVRLPQNGMAGFLGSVINGTVSNLSLVNIDIGCNFDYTQAISAAGLAVSATNCFIEDCHVSGSIHFYSEVGHFIFINTGGLIGYNGPLSTVTNCSSSCSVSGLVSDSDSEENILIQNIGGLVGYNHGTIIGSQASGCTIEALGDIWGTVFSIFEIKDIGGLAGNNQGNLVDSKAEGGWINVDTYVIGDPEPYGVYSCNVGGISGFNAGTIIRNTSSTGVSCRQGVGGLVGHNTGNIIQSFSNGSVSARKIGGGLAGLNEGNISDCYSKSNLSIFFGAWPSFSESWALGGCIGQNPGTVSNSFSTGNMNWEGYGPQNFGGFVGVSGGVNSCYWDTETSGETESAGGLGRTTLDMTYPYGDSTFVNWDFGNVWFADTQSIINGGYPGLRWQYQAPSADFTANINCGYVPLAIHFTDESFQGTGAIQQWLWDFGDGSTSAAQNPDHTYLFPGTYTISLTVTNTYDSTSVVIKDLYITAIQPVAELTLTSPSNLSFGSVFVEEYSVYRPITISSTGGASVTVSSLHFIGEPLHFELLEPFRDLVLEHGVADTLWVRFSPHTVGAITDSLYIVNDSVNEPLLAIGLQGTGLYVPPKPPENLTITMTGNDALICWDPVTQNLHDQPLEPDYYFVWFNGMDDVNWPYYFLAPVTGTQYIHQGVALGAQYMFYRVTAVKFYREDLAPNELEALLRSIVRVGMSEEEARAAMVSIRSRGEVKPTQIQP